MLIAPSISPGTHQVAPARIPGCPCCRRSVPAQATCAPRDSRGDTNRAEHGVLRQGDCEVTAERREPDGFGGGIVVVAVGALVEGCCSVGLCGMLLGPPKNGINAEAPQLRAGVRSMMWTATVSLGSAPSIKNGPCEGSVRSPRMRCSRDHQRRGFAHGWRLPSRSRAPCRALPA